MAYNAKKLTKVAEFMFRYEAGEDTLVTVKGSGYFNDATHMLKQDDVIVVIAAERAAKEVIAVTSATGADTVTTV